MCWLLYVWEGVLASMVEDVGGPQGQSGLMWRRENLLPPLVFKPQTIQPVVSYYTDYAITGVCMKYIIIYFTVWISINILNRNNLKILYK
jgi:hypothetical protein